MSSCGVGSLSHSAAIQSRNGVGSVLSRINDNVTIRTITIQFATTQTLRILEACTEILPGCYRQSKYMRSKPLLGLEARTTFAAAPSGAAAMYMSERVLLLGEMRVEPTDYREHRHFRILPTETMARTGNGDEVRFNVVFLERRMDRFARDNGHQIVFVTVHQ